MVKPKIRVEGLAEVQRELRQLRDKDLDKEMREANKAAATIVKEDAADHAPEVTGRLRKSVGVQSSTKNAVVKAGSATRVPYAGPIHFGWPARHIRPQPFLFSAVRRKAEEVRRAYEERLDALAERISSHF